MKGISKGNNFLSGLILGFVIVTSFYIFAPRPQALEAQSTIEEFFEEWGIRSPIYRKDVESSAPRDHAWVVDRILYCIDGSMINPSQTISTFCKG
jgi:hypothetical protein